ncbi:MAG TPA: hypothetical protein VHO25_24880 [Polyangiaceae bacterium]|nr:hypothetical protein [Polyangiaceae bacterium]
MSAAIQEPELTLSAEHVYSRAGRIVPSVTQILKETGLVDDQWFTEHSRWRGSAVHAMCHYDDEGDLDEATLDDRLKGYLEAYRLFKTEMGFVATHNERRVYHETLGYAGTFDIKGTFIHGECLPDIKSGVVNKVTRYQTVAYAATQERPRTLWRLGLGLKPSGKYSLKVYQPKEFDRDFRAWQSIVDFFHIRRETL